jgi:chemotaxis signal transduction protein
MTNNDRTRGSVNTHLDEIRELENKLVGLKRRFLENASAELAQFIGENDAVPFLIVITKGRGFAIPVAFVEEVVEMVASEASIENRLGLIGVFNYHGKLVPLFDLAEIADLGKNALSPENVIVICNMEKRFFGLMVAEATDVYMVESQDLEIADEVLPGAVREIGVVKFADHTAGILDLWPTVMGIEPNEMRSAVVVDGDETSDLEQQDDI